MTASTPARLVSLEVRGFRAFGTEARTMDLDASLVVVHAGNSQGKTSLAEALEFLISGRSSRRDMLGGAKAEYNDSLRNAHLPDDDTDVYVQAVVRDRSGASHQIRRELVSDFGQGTECESRLLVDGVEARDLASVGLASGRPAGPGAGAATAHPASRAVHRTQATRRLLQSATVAHRPRFIP